MNKHDLRISVAEHFSKTPGSRYRHEGDFSGEQFRTEKLYPIVQKAIAEALILLVDLDGTAGYGTSFLEEAFGGLVRNDLISADVLRNRLRFVSDEEPYLVDEVWEYIASAEKERPGAITDK